MVAKKVLWFTMKEGEKKMLRFSFMVLCVISFQTMGAATGPEQPTGLNWAVTSVVDCGCWSWLCGSSPTLTSPARGNITGDSANHVSRRDVGGASDTGRDALSVASSQDIAARRASVAGATQVAWACRRLSNKTLSLYVLAFAAFAKDLKEKLGYSETQVDSLVCKLGRSILHIDGMQNNSLIEGINDAIKTNLDVTKYRADTVLEENFPVYLKDLSLCSQYIVKDRLQRAFVSLMFTLIRYDTQMSEDEARDLLNNIPLGTSKVARWSIVSSLRTLFTGTLREELFRKFATTALAELLGSKSNGLSPNVMKTPFTVDKSECLPDETGAGVLPYR